MTQDKKKNNFEETLNKLEQIVSELESGEVSLDQSIKKFEKGIELYHDCRDYLAKAEKKIKVLTDSMKEVDYIDNE